MRARTPIATVFLAAAILLAGSSAAAQKRASTVSIRPGQHQDRYAGGVYGGYGQRGRGVQIRVHRAPRQQWVPGHYQWVTQQVWVPGWTEQVWVEPRYDWRLDYRGGRFRVLVCAGHYENIHHPGHYESRRVRIWKPGYWRNGYRGYR